MGFLNPDEAFLCVHQHPPSPLSVLERKVLLRAGEGGEGEGESAGGKPQNYPG